MENKTIYNLEDTTVLKRALSNDGIVFFNSELNMNDFRVQGELFGDIFFHPHSSEKGITVIKNSSDNILEKREGYKSFSTSNLFPHTDRSTMLNPPNLLMFYCNKQSGKGGESILIDIKGVFEEIVEDGNEEFIELIFKKVSVIFDDNITSYKGNFIEILQDGSYFFRFRNDDFSFFTPKTHVFLSYFYNLIDKHKIIIELDEGQGYIINNGRFLHGRNEYDGNREMWRILIDSNFLEVRGFESEILMLQQNKYKFSEELYSPMPNDYFADKYPISVKGVIKINDKIVLLKNEREEWELPGGKMDKGEDAIECLIREVKEELNINICKVKIIDTWLYNINNRINVFILTYLCIIKDDLDLNDIKISDEHQEIGFFDIDEIESLKMPDGYKSSIRKSFKFKSYIYE